eukprot:scaffold8240_cov133-Cylindrotheca_fusiformis.AAC.9
MENTNQRSYEKRLIWEADSSIFLNNPSTFVGVAVFALAFLVHLSLSIRIGVIGGGISGSFVSKYLVDYDLDCSLEELNIFDPNPLGEIATKEKSSDSDWQGSRVGTYQLEDGRIVELGASVITDQFKFIIEMAEGGNLTVGEPFTTASVEGDSGKLEGMAIYDGDGEVLLNTANTTSSTFYDMVWRYNLDLLKIFKITSTAIHRFDMLQSMLREYDRFFFSSPMEMWKEVNLYSFTQMSLDDLCDYLWLPKELPFWRRLARGQGSLRKELLESLMLVNYNQDNSQINALTGLGSFSSTSHSKLHSIVGGNAQLISSAFDQARRKREVLCPDTPNVVSHSSRQITTVVGSLSGFEVYATDGSMVGEYDIMVLAAPLSMARVEFLVKSHVDESVLQPMPLGGLVENPDEGDIPSDHEGHIPLPHHLSEAATRPYTQVVTTLVRHVELQLEHFAIDPEHVPRAVFTTKRGKAAEYNVTAISQISAKDNLFKVFSSQPLPLDVLQLFFGPSVEVEYEKTWGGYHGGATPDYQGKGDTTDFLLFDGATGFAGHTNAGALYYPNAMELTFACVELSAMGAKAVAKLIAQRVEWVRASESSDLGEEL